MAIQHTNLNTSQSILDDLTRFKGEYNDIYRDPFIGGTCYVFITRPMLFLEPSKPVVSNSIGQLAYENMTRDPYFTQFLISETLNNIDQQLVHSLTYNSNYVKSHFLPIFTNNVKTFSTNATSLESSDFFNTQHGYKQIMPTTKILSESSGQIMMSMQDDSNLTITKLLGIWVNYIANITDGTFNANPEMVQDGVLDYTSSIYYFVLEPDGKTLKYWAKYTGCWPTIIPYDELSYTRGDHTTGDISISFSYNTKEEMNPQLLEDFNITSLGISMSRIERQIIDSSYASFKESPLLNMNTLENTIANAKEILKSDVRDPLIIYRPESESTQTGTSLRVTEDMRSGGYELIFDDYAYNQHILEKEIDDDILNYFVDYNIGNTLRNRGE